MFMFQGVDERGRQALPGVSIGHLRRAGRDAPVPVAVRAGGKGYAVGLCPRVEVAVPGEGEAGEGIGGEAVEAGVLGPAAAVQGVAGQAALGGNPDIPVDRADGEGEGAPAADAFEGAVGLPVLAVVDGQSSEGSGPEPATGSR